MPCTYDIVYHGAKLFCLLTNPLPLPPLSLHDAPPLVCVFSTFLLLVYWGGLGEIASRGNRAAQNRRRMVEEDGDEAYFNESDEDDYEAGTGAGIAGDGRWSGMGPDGGTGGGSSGDGAAGIGPHRANGGAATGGGRSASCGGGGVLDIRRWGGGGQGRCERRGL